MPKFLPIVEFDEPVAIGICIVSDEKELFGVKTR